MTKYVVIAVAALTALSTSSARAQSMSPTYAGTYGLSDLGSVPGLPPPYGGLTLKYNDTNTLLIGGAANTGAGAIYEIQVVRGAGDHIIGFSGTVTLHAIAEYNDGGVVYGPGNVLFLARWPVNGLGQVLPGSAVTDKIIDMSAFGMEGSLSALNFIPAGFPGAGRVKMVTWAGGQWNDVVLAPDGMGMQDVVSVTEVPASRLPGGPEGFVFVEAGRPLFPSPAMLVSEYSAGNVAAYDMDTNGDPIVASRRDFVVGLGGAEGAFIDPLTGDFLFSTFGGGDRVVVVRGFTNACTTCRGDVNADTRIDGADVRNFVQCLLLAVPPTGLCHCADVDIDNDVDTDDAVLLVAKLLNDADTACP